MEHLAQNRDDFMAYQKLSIKLYLFLVSRCNFDLVESTTALAANHLKSSSAAEA